VKPDLSAIRRAIEDGQELVSWLRNSRWNAFLGQVERKATMFVSTSLGTLLHAARAATFQARVSAWAESCFGAKHYDMTQRGDRLLEEVLELLQAKGYDRARIPQLVDYVYGRLAGEPVQEVGGVMITLSTFCTVANIDMQAAGEAELERISQPAILERIRAKQRDKDRRLADSPLPGHAKGKQA
jgi:NTP pyrophosphatase (non-canonical NTP hydrolase)